jgi:hypothetical protein
MLYFQLRPGAPAINAGMKIDGTINKDYNGISVPQDGVIEHHW